MESVPYSAQIVEVDLCTLGQGVESNGVRGEAVSDVIPRNRGFVEGDHGVKGLGDPSQIEY